MTTSVTVGGSHAVAPPQLWLLLCIALLGSGAVFANLPPSPPPLHSLDATLMKAVTASVSQQDVSAVLAHQRSKASVHIQLRSSCDQEQRCTVFTAMDFPDAETRVSAMSLHVAVHVVPGATMGPGKATASWQVQSSDAATDGHAVYAGDFSDLQRVPPIGERAAIARLLTSIESAVGKVLVSNAIIATPNGKKGAVPVRY